MKTLILGGGLGGLSAAYYTLKRFPKSAISLIESSNRLGGWIRSFECNNGVIFEQGPRTVRVAGPAGANTLKLVEEIGLEEQIVPITKSHPAATNRLIYVNGKLHKLPTSLKDLFVTRSPFSRPLVSLLLRDLIAPAKKVPEMDEPLYDFIHRRFGEEIAEYVIGPMVAGICAGNAKEISVNFLMRPLFEMEQQYGSIIKGLIFTMPFRRKGQLESSSLVRKAASEKWSIFSFPYGMETLTRTLGNIAREEGVDVELEAKCTEINFDSNKVSLSLEDGSQHSGDVLVSSIPAMNLANLIKHQHPQLSQLLKNIRTTTVGVVNLCFDRDLEINDAFGFLVAPKENLPILGVIYDSCCFPRVDKTVFTVMLGGYRFEEFFGEDYSKDDIFRVALNHTKQILKIEEDPVNYQVQVLKNCIPQYTVGHNTRIKAIEEYIEEHKLPLCICGASYYGVGINDVIFSAKKAVEGIYL